MKMRYGTRLKVEGLINDIYLFQSFAGTVHDICKQYRIGTQYLKYLRELNIIDTDLKNRKVIYTNPKNHSKEYILDYVMSRYSSEYLITDDKKLRKTNMPSDLVTLEVDLPKSMKDAAQEVIYRNHIKNIKSDLLRQEARINEFMKELEQKNKQIETLLNKKSTFAKLISYFK